MSPTKLDLSQIQFPDSMGIRDAALYTGMSEQYIRTMVRQTTLKASKNEAGEWEILKSTLDELMAQPRQRGEQPEYRCLLRRGDRWNGRLHSQPRSGRHHPLLRRHCADAT